eukprot:87245_1
MSEVQFLTKWISVQERPINRPCSIKIPTGIDSNNYIIIDHNSCYKYNIDNDKWIKIDGFENIKRFSAATLDIKKGILFLFQSNSMTQIALKNNNPIINDIHDAEIHNSAA